MTRMPKAFKPVPKRFHPRGMPVLYEDHDLLVVDKPAGMLTISYAEAGWQPDTALEILSDYVRKGNPKSHKHLHIVHRLDRDTSGVLVFAKHEEARGYLIDHWAEFNKIYLAVVRGGPPEPEGEIFSHLAEGADHKMFSVRDPAMGEAARTGYKVLRRGETCSLLEVRLHTGKKNQIRVHFSEQGFPVLGDRKYGDKTRGMKRLALHATSMALLHPHTHEPMEFSAPIPKDFEKWMSAKPPEDRRRNSEPPRRREGDSAPQHPDQQQQHRKLNQSPRRG